MKKILVLALALAMSPVIMAKSVNHSTKGHSVQKSAHAKPTHRNKAKPSSHRRTAKPHTNKAGTHR